MGIIIDTDIGSDIDDALAIAYAIKSKIDIKLITTVHGPVKLRAHIAKKFTEQLSVNIPVAIGESKPLKQYHIFTTGLEGEGYIKGNENLDVIEDGINALVNTITENKNDINIVAIGPLTNIAKALQKDNNLASYINHIYIMGNAITAKDKFYLNYRSHNFKADPEAADIVFGADIPKTIITTKICKKNYLTKNEMNMLKGNPALDYIKSAGAKWMKLINNNVVYLYDPLVVHHILDDNVTKKVSYGNVRITTNVSAFKNTLLNKILRC